MAAPPAGRSRSSRGFALDRTPANYLGRVSKARILEAVREAVSPVAAENIASLKKTALAEAAALRLKDWGWLPPLLRTPLPQPQTQAA
jgi:ParB family chromosome partitioning protein